jgi:hypothetical protein
VLRSLAHLEPVHGDEHALLLHFVAVKIAK